MIDALRRFAVKRSNRRVETPRAYGGSAEPGDLDIEFYRGFYPDLAALSDQAAIDHWKNYGMTEGRVANVDGLPSDFVAYDYVAANADLVSICTDAPSAVRHYLRNGRAEQRNYSMGAEDTAFLETYRSLLGCEVATVDRRWRWAPSNAESYLRHGLFRDTRFLREFDVLFYAAIAGLDVLGSWLQAACIIHFVKQGLEDLLPISPHLSFDPVYYRDYLKYTFGEASARRSDRDLHREWLEAGEDRVPGNLQNFTRKRLGIECTYDNIVPLEIYRLANDDLAGMDFSGLITHVLNDGLFEQRSSIKITRRNISVLTQYADHLARSGELVKAENLYRRFQHFVEDYSPLNEHFANVLLENGRYTEAFLLYRSNITAGQAGPWCYFNAALCCDRLNDLAGGLAILEEGTRVHSDSIRLRHARDHVADRFFADEFRLARAEAMAGRIPIAHERLAAAAERCTISVESLAPTRPVRTVALFANMDLPQCTFYRVEQKVEQLVAAGYRVKTFDWMLDESLFARDMAACDAVIFYRVAAFPKIIRAIVAARAAGLHVFYEIDDLVFDGAEFPEGFDAYAGQITWSEYIDVALGVPLFRHAMNLCDYAIASTPALARRMEPLVLQRRAFVHRNGLGQRHLAAMASASQRTRRQGEPIVIFYGSGTKAHKRDVENILLPALEEIDRRFGERVKFVIAGHPPVCVKSDLLARIRFEPFVSDVETYWAQAGKADIALSVLKRTPVTDSKSEIKWLEAAMFSAPAVISATETFAEVVNDGDDGLLATDTAGFVEALSRLVSNDSYRVVVGAAAYRKAKAEYAPDVLSANLMAVFDAVQPPRLAAIRILVVNVFYAPQAIGGATRVVIDNIRNLRALYGAAFEFEVFTTLEGGLEPYAVSVYCHEGVRVTAMTASNRGDVDSVAIDSGAGEVFRRCVERFAPDLVHFHCIQRITAAATEVVRAMDIPYVITAHDGWWICDHQFLHDANGLIAPYDFENLFRFRPRVAGVEFGRPSDLLPSLRSAAAIVSVSEPFAAIYRATGLTNVRTIANGLPDDILDVVERRLRPTSDGGKVRIGHVGGLEAHKGFPLLKRALEAARPHNISLLAVDLAMSIGEVREEVWSDVEVRFVARRPQAAVMSLYDSIDVLFAPSLWPESFGLVTREALAAGCWIVASDRGAIGEPVEDGVDGHIVSVDNLSGLIAVIRKIDSDPAHYKTPPPCTRTPRTSSDQARDLAALYRDLIKKSGNRE